MGHHYLTLVVYMCGSQFLTNILTLFNYLLGIAKYWFVYLGQGF